MRLILLHNPGSGDEDHSRGQLETMLTAAGHEVVYRSLDDAGWEDVLGERGDLIVVAGGDGSVRKVLTAIGESPITVTLFPTGSANNIARTLGFETEDPAQLLAGWEPAASKTYDVWDAEWGSGRSRFVESFGGGLFADVLALAEQTNEDPSGAEKVDLGLRLLAEAVERATPEAWELEIDGERHREELLGAEAMNVRELGPNLPLAPEADPGDGLLDVVLLRPEDRPQLAAYVAARLRRQDGELPRLRVRRARRVALELPASCRVHVDDKLLSEEPDSSRRVDIERANMQLDLLVPRSAHPQE